MRSSTAYFAPYTYPSVRAFIPWVAHRNRDGEWVVERHGAWSCCVRLTDPSPVIDERQEDHARRVAAALNRIYAP